MGGSKPDYIGIDHQAIFDANPDVSFILSQDGQILDANQTAVERYGYSLEELKQMTVADLAPADLKPKFAEKLNRKLTSGATFEWRHRRKDGAEFPVEIYIQPIVVREEQVILSRVHEISRRKLAENLISGQNQILEMIAAGSALPETLDAIVRLIEDQSPGMLGSILLLDDDGIRVRHGAAPSLPMALVAAVDDQPIGPSAGSCGTAAYRKEAVFVEDIAIDPLWEEYKAAALPYGLHACWSTPIFDAREQVLGTFAMYYRQPGLPKPQHLRLIDTATHIAAIAINHHRAEKTLQASEARYHLLFDYAPDGIVIADADSYYLDANTSACRILGYTHDELVGLHASDIVVPTEIKNIDPALQEIKAGANYHREWQLRRKDGSVFAAEVMATKMPDGNLLGMIRDITERKASDAKIRRLSQLYAALSQCNQAIVRCATETELFRQICHDAIHFGGMEMAWIGLIDDKTKLVNPVASYGTGIDYLDGIEISVDGNRSTGRGPTGTSIRENRPVWVQDFQHDQATATWHGRAAKFGWGSSASLPLQRNGVVVGAFTLYTGDANGFDEMAQKLLMEMALDISFALDRFASEDERRRAEEALRVSEQHWRTIIETEPECVKILDRDGKLLAMNPAGLAMLEIDSIEEARQHNLLDFILPEYKEAFRSLHRSVMSGESATLEFEMAGLKGARRWLETHAAPMRDERGNVVTLLGITRDITERKLAAERIQYLANFDALTGLPNRIHLADHLKYALSLAKRNEECLAVLFVDIDRFKDINDTLGHSIGDAFLVETARRLQSVLREEDTVSRLGGDEFILILPGDDAKGAALVAQKILQVISKPYHDDQHDLVVTASIGIALYPGDGNDMESLSRSADTAMYRAKQEGRNGYRFFTAEMQTRATRNMQLLNALRQAVRLDQFQLHYQPQVSIRGGHIIGVEALLRWQHPELGHVSPAEFIPVAEDSGLILLIGEWALRTAARQLKSWMDKGLPQMVIAVNLSAVQFRHPNLPDMVRSILQEVRLPAECLELELTEGVAMHDAQKAITVMDKLHELGIRMSIDDFGTGYSSLNYLKKFKAYKLKIDQTFVRDISTDLEDRAIVAAIISMAKNLGLQTIAEGVETADQLAYLREQGCNEAQGYYFSKPLPAAQLEAFLRTTGTASVEPPA